MFINIKILMDPFCDQKYRRQHISIKQSTSLRLEILRSRQKTWEVLATHMVVWWGGGLLLYIWGAAWP